MERISRSWELLKASWGVLRSDRQLLIYPLVSGLLSLVVIALFIVPLAATGTITRWGQNTFSVVDAVIAFAFYFVNYSVIIFCNAALVGAANIRLNGGDPTLSDGFRIAASRLPQIIGWALVSASVGMVLRAISERGGILGVIAAAIVGIAWSIATFLVVPVLVVEGLGPIAAVKRSASLLRLTWGEQIVGNAGIGIIVVLLILGVLLIGGAITAVLFAVAALLGVAALVALVVVVVFLGLIGAALSGIFTIALYRYATTGNPGSFFSPATLQSAFRPK